VTLSNAAHFGKLQEVSGQNVVLFFYLHEKITFSRKTVLFNIAGQSTLSIGNKSSSGFV